MCDLSPLKAICHNDGTCGLSPLLAISENDGMCGLSPFQAILLRAWVTAFISIITLEVETL